MKKILNYKSKKIVNIFDDVNIWSAPFGRLLLENIPMQKGIVILDIGFGTGFPLIELSQRFGVGTQVYGIDIWKNGIKRTRKKINTLGLKNITIFEKSASKINLPDNHASLITSNLGINNFEEKEKVYAEIHRVLKKDGNLCITTNPIGTFKELFQLFEEVAKEMNLKQERKKIKEYIKHRGTKETIVNELEQFGLKLTKQKSDKTTIRFANAEAFFNHSLIRIGFRSSWDNIITEENQNIFYKKLKKKIKKIIKTDGFFQMTIPILYLEFKK